MAEIDFEFECKKISFDGKTVEIEGADVEKVIMALCDQADYDTVMVAADSTEDEYEPLIEWIDVNHGFEVLIQELPESRREEIFKYFGYVESDN